MNKREATKELPIFLDVDEIATMLRIEKRTVYEWIRKNQIPHRKAGRRVIFLLSEVMEWTETGTK